MRYEEKSEESGAIILDIAITVCIVDREWSAKTSV